MSSISADRNSKQRSSRLICRRAALIAAAISGLAGAAHAADGTWAVNASGVWDGLTDSANWVGGIAASGAGFTADFSQVDINADRTVTLGADITIGNLIFGDAATISNNWIIAPGTPAHTLTLAGATPTIT